MNILRNNTLNMLLACGSPGSAMAYHLNPTLVQPGLVHRSITGEEAPGLDAGIEAAPVETTTEVATSAPFSVLGWISAVFERLERRTWEHEMRERESYLAKSQNVYDLECRMRDLESDGFNRHNVLR